MAKKSWNHPKLPPPDPQAVEAYKVAAGRAAPPRGPHKLTLNAIEALEQAGLHPVIELARTLAEIEDPGQRASVLLSLMEYIYPKRKAVEHSGGIVTATTNDLSHAEIMAILAGDPFTKAIEVDGKAD
jgi:hypothetical protein